MRNAETVLGVIRERGRRGLPLTGIYRQLFNPERFLHAYAKLARNRGAMTPGVTAETGDGMCLAGIQAIIARLRYERYRWSPVRRIYIATKRSRKRRPLGLPTWSDKLLQEVIRSLLEAYYEPQLSDHGHGFRPGRGCHTALTEIRRTWKGVVWFIEGAIAQCFDSLDHGVLMAILREKIQDHRFVRVIANLLKAGYLEQWVYHATLRGAPQGGVVSPILSNIDRDRRDQDVEQVLLPRYPTGKVRRPNRAYPRQQAEAARLESWGYHTEARACRKQMRMLPSGDPQDPGSRRLRYGRYADDVLLGFTGPRSEAGAIKHQLGNVLREQRRLTLSEENTLIPHGRTEAARVLGYNLLVFQADHKLDKAGRRVINGKLGLRVPRDVVQAKSQPYKRHGKPIHRAEMAHDTVFSIVAHDQQGYRGLVEYYRMAYNRSALDALHRVMEQSLTMTLANKLKTRVSTIYARYRHTIQTPDGPRKVLQVIVPREGRRPLVAQWGGVPLKWRARAVLDDCPKPIWNGRNERLVRLLAATCELCGAQGDMAVPHVRALADLQQRGRAARPAWMTQMAARQRQTLVVCAACHHSIHAGRAQRSTHGKTRTLESRMR
jgi:group II intron reverse transcriptase/maturase